MKPAVSTLAADLAAPRPCKWRVELRDTKSGRIMPVIVPEADAEFRAISSAINRAALFIPGCDWKPVSAHRCL